MSAIDDRRARLEGARLYLVCDARPGGVDPEPFLHEVLAAGVDMVQLREKRADECTVLGAAEIFRRVCEEHGALFWVNDRPDLARAARAAGVHVGQDDMPVAAARTIAGPDLLVGRSTHSVEQVDAACGAPERERPDYIAVGPVHATPTKPGRPAIGLDPIRHAAAAATLPWFAIGGIDARTIGPVLEAGARRVVVVRAIAEAPDPAAAAAELKAALVAAGEEAPVGPA